MKEQLKIQLKNMLAKKVEITNITDINIDENSLEVNTGYTDENPYLFMVIFIISVIDTNNRLKVNVEYVAEFETSDEIDDDFKNSHFTKINAPAIAYPYLRAYISNLLNISGYNPIILPTINFSED